MKNLVQELELLQFHYNCYKRSQLFWQSIEQDCPSTVIGVITDHKDSPKVGGGGEGGWERTNTPHELRTVLCFGFATVSRVENNVV